MFIDETSVKTNLTRLRGRARRGQRLEMDALFGNWGTQTFIAGLAAGGLIAPWVIKGAMDGPAFAAYVKQVLAPSLTPASFWTISPPLHLRGFNLYNLGTLRCRRGGRRGQVDDTIYEFRSTSAPDGQHNIMQNTWGLILIQGRHLALSAHEILERLNYRFGFAEDRSLGL